MYNLAPLKIDLKGLQEGLTTVDIKLDDAFFEAIEAPDIKRGQLDLRLTISRNESFFELMFDIKGQVIVPCDLCLDDMLQPVACDERLVVKFGDEYSEDDDLVTVNEDEGILDVAWFVYEFIVLNIPIRHVHAPGKCNPAMMKVLDELSTSRSGEEDEEHNVDPRWETLRQLNIKD